MSLDVRRIAAQLRVLADAFEGDYTPAATAAAANIPLAAPAAPAPRGRGRPPRGEAAPAAAVAAPPADNAHVAPGCEKFAEPDPFAAPPPAAPTATIEQVHAALTDLKNAVSRDVALAVLKGAGGADNLPSLSPASYGTVVLAAKAKQAEYTKAPEPVIEADPFAVPAAAPAAAPEKPLTVEDVKAAVVAATKRTGADRAAKVVMDLGGKAAKADGTGFGPSWTALPKEQYAAAIAALNALPTTK